MNKVNILDKHVENLLLMHLLTLNGGDVSCLYEVMFRLSKESGGCVVV